MTTTGSILRFDGSHGFEPTTAAFPDTSGTSGNVLTSDGSNWSSTAPAIVNTSRPAFIAVPSGTLSNVTGDGTAYTIVWGSIPFQYGSNFNTSTGIFTAPSTGFYQLNCSFQIQGMLVGHTTMYANFTTSGGAVYFFSAINPFVCSDVAAASYIANGSALVFLTAAQTVVVSFSVSSSTKVISVTTNSQFSGFLVC